MGYIKVNTFIKESLIKCYESISFLFPGFPEFGVQINANRAMLVLCDLDEVDFQLLRLITNRIKLKRTDLGAFLRQSLP